MLIFSFPIFFLRYFAFSFPGLWKKKDWRKYTIIIITPNCKPYRRDIVTYCASKHPGYLAVDQKELKTMWTLIHMAAIFTAPNHSSNWRLISFVFVAYLPRPSDECSSVLMGLQQKFRIYYARPTQMMEHLPVLLFVSLGWWLQQLLDILMISRTSVKGIEGCTFWRSN